MRRRRQARGRDTGDDQRERADLVVSRMELATLFRVGVNAVNNWIAHGLPVKREMRGRGVVVRIDLREALPWYASYKDARTTRTLLDVARTSFTRMQEERVRLELEQTRAEFIPVGEAERLLAGAVAVARSRLREFPRRAALRVAPADPRPAELVLEGEVGEILKDFAADTRL